MDAVELEASLRELDTLAHEEYHASLAQVATTPGDSDEHRLLRLGRLLGVILNSSFTNWRSETRPGAAILVGCTNLTRPRFP